MKQILPFILSFACLPCFSQTGTPDGTFGTGGKVITPIGNGTDDFGYATLVQPDGKIVVVGATGSEDGSDFAVVRYNADGSLDNSFDGDGKAVTNLGGDDTPNAVARQADGKIVVAGYTSDEATGEYDFAVVRYNADGSLDNSFDGDGKAVTNVAGDDDEAFAVAIQPDGKILVGGYGSGSGFAVVRYNADGSLDNSFDGDGKAVTSFGAEGEAIASLALQADGKIVAGGSAYYDDSGYDFVVLRYHSNGSPDNTFDGDGEAVTDFIGGDDGIYAMVLQGDERIVAVGSTTNAADEYDFAVVRYNADGSLDNSFDGDGKVVTDVGGDDDEAWGVHIQSDGKILAGGFNVNTSAETSDFALVRYTATGTPDPAFGNGGKATVDFGGSDLAYGMAVYGTRIYAAGFTDIDGAVDFALAALQNDVAAPLPLSLTSFAASKQTNKVQLNWTTVNEQNISAFEVLRSSDGLRFASIGSVKAVGNSSAKQNYTFTDALPVTGTNHYRLRIMEAGGKVTHSAIVAVKMTASGKLEVFPNPVRGSLNVQFTSLAARPLQIQDASGRVVKTVSVNQTGNVTVPVDVSGLQKGIYFVRAEGETVRFVKE